MTGFKKFLHLVDRHEKTIFLTFFQQGLHDDFSFFHNAKNRLHYALYDDVSEEKHVSLAKKVLTAFSTKQNTV